MHFMPFDSQTAKLNARKSHAARTADSPLGRPKTPLTQATELQRALHRVGMSVAKDVSNDMEPDARARLGSSLASIAKGWDSLAARVQILRGKAAPGTLSPAERRAKALERKQPVRSTGPKLVTPSDPSVVQEPKESISQG